MSMLDQILETKRKELESIVIQPNERSFEKYSLVDAVRNRSREVALIAEVKKASPSKGLIRKEFDPVQIAMVYEAAGVDAISVLTDRTFFQGEPSYLQQIKQVVNRPVLRKDFIIDPIQVEESAALGADAILLIAAATETAALKELYRYAKGLDLDVLLEVHTEWELDAILTAFTPELIGINNRNLTTFETKLKNTMNISRHIPRDIPFVSESGIHTYQDVNTIKTAGASAILVGEQLMRAADIGEAIGTLLQEEVLT